MRRAPDRPSAILDALFWGPVLLAAIWIVVWPPLTVDGPAHLLGATAWADHGDAIYREYYEIDTFPTPNLAGTALLGALVKVGSLRFAETVMLLLAGLGPPLALRYAIRAVRPESAWLAIAGLPLSFGYLYFYGFWNYCLAIALALVCVGLILRVAPSWSPRSSAVVAAVLTLTWLTHLVPFVAAALFLAAVVATGPRGRQSIVIPALTLLPAAVLSVAYLLHTDSGDGPTWTNPIGRALGLVSLHTTVTTYTRLEDAVAGVLAVVLLGLGLVARRLVPGAPAASRAAGLAALAAAVLVLVTPTKFGIDFGLIDERLAVFPVLFGVLWLAARPFDPTIALRAAVALVVVTVALAGVRVSKLNDYDGLADEYLSAGRFIDDGSVLVALRFASLGPDAGRNAAWDPTRHLASELAAQKHSIDVGHYEAVLDYFTARFREPSLRDAIDPGYYGLEQVPASVDLPAYRSECGDGILIPPHDNASALLAVESGATVTYDGFYAAVPSEQYMQTHRIEYVLLIAPDGAQETDGRALSDARRALSCEYERVGVTSPRGLVEVWKLRG